MFDHRSMTNALLARPVPSTIGFLDKSWNTLVRHRQAAEGDEANVMAGKANWPGRVCARPMKLRDVDVESDALA